MKLYRVILVMLFVVSAYGRTWTSIDGRTSEAELKSYNPSTGIVTLIRNGGREVRLNCNQLSEADNAFLKEYFRQRKEAAQRALENAAKEKAELEEKETAKAGTVVTYTSAGKHELSYYVYYPRSYAYGQKNLPLLILFSPQGNGRGIINSFRRSANDHGLILVGCDGFKNNMNESLGKKRFKEVLPDIEKNVPHNPNEYYMGGMSGGAWRAYYYSAHFDRPWKGIVACGGWLGGDEYSGLKYRKNMAVAMVNGDADDAANGWIDHDTAELENRRCKVKVFHFPGGHIGAPPDVFSKAIKWVLENRDR